MSAEYPTRRSRKADARRGIAPAATGGPRRADRRAPSRSQPAGSARPDVFFVVLVVLALLKAWLSRALGIGAADPLLAFALESAAIVFFLGAADLIWRRRSYTIDLIAYTALSLVMLANVIYLSYFAQIFSPALLSVIGQAGEVGGSIEALIKPVYALYLIDIPFLIGWAVLSRRARSHRPAGRSRFVAIATGVAAIALAVQIVLVLGISADVDGSAVARARGFGAYQLASLVRLGLPDPNTSTVAALEHQPGVSPARAFQMKIDAVRHANTGARIGDVKTGQYRGKNVIIIQVEALQDFVIGARYQGKEITPNLNRLVRQSWHFPNTFSQISGGNTADAEWVANSSLLAPVHGAASLEYSDRKVPGLPRVLGQHGYDAITLHQNDVHFWNRKELYRALGFRKYWDKSYFKNRDKMWHASDEVLFSDGMKVLRTEEASTAPFYSFFITESSHSAFTAVPMDRRPLKVSAADAKTLSGLYIGAISYTDLAIGEFVSALKKNGMWDDSIVIIYGDHSAVLNGAKAGDARVADQILGRPYSPVDYQRIPLIVHLPNETVAHVDTRTVGQADVMPTVADLLGIDLSSTPHVGRSVFVDAPPFAQIRAFLPAGSFANRNVVFMPGLSFEDGKAVSLSTAQNVPATEQERQDMARAEQLTALSDAWVRSLPKRPDARGTADSTFP